MPKVFQLIRCRASFCFVLVFVFHQSGGLPAEKWPRLVRKRVYLYVDAGGGAVFYVAHWDLINRI